MVRPGYPLLAIAEAVALRRNIDIAGMVCCTSVDYSRVLGAGRARINATDEACAGGNRSCSRMIFSKTSRHPSGLESRVCTRRGRVGVSTMSVCRLREPCLRRGGNLRSEGCGLSLPISIPARHSRNDSEARLWYRRGVRVVRQRFTREDRHQDRPPSRRQDRERGIDSFPTPAHPGQDRIRRRRRAGARSTGCTGFESVGEEAFDPRVDPTGGASNPGDRVRVALPWPPQSPTSVKAAAGSLRTGQD